MKTGDIVYFKSVYTALYGKEGGTYEYHFKPGDRYLIENINSGWTIIKNLEDGTSHFAHSAHWERIITQDQWRELQLEKLITLKH